MKGINQGRQKARQNHRGQKLTANAHHRHLSLRQDRIMARVLEWIGRQQLSITQMRKQYPVEMSLHFVSV